MTGCLAETGVAVIGGDQRQIRVVEELLNRAAWVRTYALYGEFKDLALQRVEDEESAVAGAGVVLFPISGVSQNGTVRTGEPSVQLQLSSDFFRRLEPGALIVTGRVPEIWSRTASDLGIRLLEYAELDEVAVPNAIPTAEGAIGLAIQAVPVTLYGNPCLITGFGRVAQALARMLLGMGAEVYVAARNPRQMEMAEKMGCQTLPIRDLADEIGRMWVVFNTVPALVLTREVLRNARTKAAIIDLASAPGGTDFDTARELGLYAVLALGLPGKVAPLTAGDILASTIPDLIEKELSCWVGMEAKTCKQIP